MADFRTGFAWNNAGAYTLKLRHTGSENVGGGQGAMITTDLSCTLATNQDQTIFQKVNGEPWCRADGNANAITYKNLVPCLTHRMYKDPPILVHEKEEAMIEYIVRRLMPIECERLQGFPDNWTRISWKGKPEEDCPDSKRYQCCGNSMAVPVMRWIGQRIEQVETE